MPGFETESFGTVCDRSKKDCWTAAEQRGSYDKVKELNFTGVKKPKQACGTIGKMIGVVEERFFKKLDPKKRKKQKALGLMLPVLLAGFVFAMVKSLGSPARTVEAADVKPLIKFEVTQIEWEAPGELVILRDPMSSKKISTERVEQGDYMVEGIVQADGQVEAMIDGKLVREGEVVNGAMVVRIYEDRVEFEKNGLRWSQLICK